MTETIHPELPTTRRRPFDPPARLGELRAEAPITPLGFPDGHDGWLVTGHDLARAVLADLRFSNRAELKHAPVRLGGQVIPQQPPAPPGLFISTDPPVHSRYRRLLTGQFTVRRMNQLTPRIERIVADQLAEARAQGSPVDLVPHFALPVPSLVICELLGVPYAERASFQRDTAIGLRMTSSLDEAMAAVERIREHVRGLVDRKKAEPTDDMLSGLVATGELTDEESANIGLMLLIAGHETTANMLGLGAYALLRNPEQLAALRAEPELVDGAVEELMRYLSIIQFGTTRVALEDVELAGARVRAGQTVVLSLPAANRDPERFERPDELDVRRRAGGHLGFGHGVHQCLGQQLARVEMRAGLAGLLREFPDLRLAVPESEVPLRTDMGVYGVHALPVGFSA
ncbi:cytochrome P450 [Actinosynnema pretiosum subsp. pretiosum]|uniref:Cytochrome P450 n=1 Tax=Actinosynnema pretiosum subsp. pretiosum TaxID=103721 RepID=A0AA45LB51_9PSEU|nr:putative cytochrome P450 hydroxylase [Actinosynnema pretiosum subsp. pretiosum]QUF07044.1 cytochrome P450 [Actinosynnema pretiosum subsp. pretiosum]